VVVTLWQDEFERRDGRLIYHGRPMVGDRRPGRRELIENLAYAWEHCGGRFYVIVAVAKSVSTDRRVIKLCFPQQAGHDADGF